MHLISTPLLSSSLHRLIVPGLCLGGAACIATAYVVALDLRSASVGGTLVGGGDTRFSGYVRCYRLGRYHCVSAFWGSRERIGAGAAGFCWSCGDGVVSVLGLSFLLAMCCKIPRSL